MFLRVTKQRNKAGKQVKYLALAESVRVKGKKHPQTIIVHNFGRATPKTIMALLRLEKSLANYIDTEAANHG